MLSIPDAYARMAGFASSLGYAVLTVVLSSVILALVVAPPTLTPTASFIKARDNRRSLSYEIIGDKGRSNCIIWLHGILSSRYETLALDKDILNTLDAYVVSYDRPGYGESTTLRRRNFESEVENIEDLANSLGVHKFYLAAVSGGGPYALAAASVIPHRLRGVLLLSAAGSPGFSDAPVVSEEQQSRHPYFRKALQYPRVLGVFQYLAETYAGGRALYTLWLEKQAGNLVGKFSAVDRRCIMKEHRNSYFLKVVPEATKQGTATALIQDLLLISQPWSFNVSSISVDLQPAMHFWHGTDDLQVHHDHTQKYNSLLPKATMRIIENGGHMAYWACNKEQQRQAINQLIKAGLTDSQ